MSRNRGWGTLVRLYGSSTGGRKFTGASGRDIDSGEAKLDLGFVKEALEEGQGSSFLVPHDLHHANELPALSRAHSLCGRIFDEIQAIKNPDSLRADAARAVNARLPHRADRHPNRE